MRRSKRLLILLFALGVVQVFQVLLCAAQDGDIISEVPVAEDIDKTHSTDPNLVKNEQLNKLPLEGLSNAHIEELRSKAQNYTFKAEVNRMMKLIINSLYKNKDIFLRELISNASDALDKIRLMALTNPDVLNAVSELAIRIKVDKDNRVLHITDTGIGMTADDLVKNLGTIAKSGTAEFLNKMNENSEMQKDLNDMIGQFGVGFYSAFLVAEKVIVTTKHNDDNKQYIWESDANSFSIVEDPRGPTLARGTQVSLQLRNEATDYSDPQTIKNLVSKYSQFINFPIYLWTSKTVEEEVPLEEGEQAAEEEKAKDKNIENQEDEVVEEDTTADKTEAEDKPKTKKIEKTVWDWELLNNNKPIWTRKPDNITEEEYNSFYKALTKDYQDPLTKVHFSAEGEVSFKSLLFIPKVQPSMSFNRYGTVSDNIKLYVRRVFITDEFTDLLPSYLNFVRGIVDSDDLPINVSRETLQQDKLLKIIKKKLIRKIIDALKKLDEETYKEFWAQYSTNIKLGLYEDSSNKERLAKLIRFQSSATEPGELVSLSQYVSRMKPGQDQIYYIAGPSRTEVEKSPFVEKLLRKGYEVLYLTDPVDEYAITTLTNFEKKSFQNVAKEGLELVKDKKKLEDVKERFEPLIKWLEDVALKNMVSKVSISQRLTDSPCALVASMFGWTGNMERLAMANAHQKSDDPQRDYYMKQKKTLEINPKHPLIKDLLRRIKDDPEEAKAKDIAHMMFRTAVLRSGYMVQDTYEFAKSVESLMKEALGISEDEFDDVDDFDEEEEEQEATEDGKEATAEQEVKQDEKERLPPAEELEEHDEL